MRLRRTLLSSFEVCPLDVIRSGHHSYQKKTAYLNVYQICALEHAVQ